MSTFIRVVIALALASLAVFCVVGFLATFEPPGHLAWRFAYGLLFVGSLAGIVWTLGRRLGR